MPFYKCREIYRTNNTDLLLSGQCHFINMQVLQYLTIAVRQLNDLSAFSRAFKRWIGIFPERIKPVPFDCTGLPNGPLMMPAYCGKHHLLEQA